MSEAQADTFRRLLSLLFGRGARLLRHGCATGVDEQAALLAREFLMHVVAHPGHLLPWTSAIAVEASQEVMPRKANRERNRDLADHAASGGVLLACPAGPEDDPSQTYSGTWQTIRMARRRRQRRAPMAVVTSDGVAHYSLWDGLPG